jgi:hypothetical protein
MNKEIVIAAHNEIVSWMPDAWCSSATIYRCGEPTASPKAKISHAQQVQRTHAMMANTRGLDDSLASFAKQLNACRMVMEFVDEMNRRPRETRSTEERTTDAHAEKQTANCPHGRESEQWLNHIIWRYDTLAEVTVFLQAHPHDHCPDVIALVDAIQHVDFQTLPHRLSGAISDPEQQLCHSFYSQLELTPLSTICWAAGAQFAASRKVLRSQPRSWYEKVRELARQTPRSGEILERLWWNVLGCPSIAEIAEIRDTRG